MSYLDEEAQVLREERRNLFASPERAAEILERYETRLFSEGRPGVILRPDVRRRWHVRDRKGRKNGH